MKSLAILVILVALTACTSVSYESPDGTKFKVSRFSPMGEELQVSGALDGVGHVDVNKASEDAQGFAQAVLDGLVRAAGSAATPGI